jgi:hypothetical protein
VKRFELFYVYVYEHSTMKHINKKFVFNVFQEMLF